MTAGYTFTVGCLRCPDAICTPVAAGVAQRNWTRALVRCTECGHTFALTVVMEHVAVSDYLPTVFDPGPPPERNMSAPYASLIDAILSATYEAA